MAWWEYVPIVKTIGHAIEDPPGRAASDYAQCRTTADECEQSTAVAILRCTDCVKNAVAKYATDWTGSAIGTDFFETAISVSALGIGAALAKGALGGTFLGLSASAWTGIGTVLAVDALADAAIIIYKLKDMYTAAQDAMKQYCVCPP